MRDTPITIVWFRDDLRLNDNPALSAAAANRGKVCLVYIRETDGASPRKLGGAAEWWLHQSLTALGADITSLGGTLLLRQGPALETLQQLITETGATGVAWNRRYDALGRNIDAQIKTTLRQQGVSVESHNARLLTEPWDIQTKSGSYYRVFTPYWKYVRAHYTPPAALTAPQQLTPVDGQTETLDSWSLCPTRPNWAAGFDEAWAPGEASALARLEAWLDGAISHYRDQRNRPDLETGTSRLSPHLRWGEIGPAQIWRAVQHRLEAGEIEAEGAQTFLSEVVWREFAHVLLFHNPALASDNYNPGFDHMPWRDNAADFAAWCKGLTGYPLVDAGMRQLWTTGWMHNRVRMVTGSFLTKHLLLPWQWGEDWFWDTLVDADAASNAASWQWVAGSGADAAPYFRVFNPITQGEKFDETGDYVRQWCPELAQLPNKYLFAPWRAPETVLATANVALGTDYPHPIVDHTAGRNRALAAYNELKTKRDAA